MTKPPFALLALCFCAAVLLTGCFKPEPLATLPQTFAPLWDEADEPISGLWRRAALHGKVKVVGFVPYKGKVDQHGRVQKLKGPVVIAKSPGYVSSGQLLAYPLDIVTYPYLLDFGPNGLRSQTAYDDKGAVVWTLGLNRDKAGGYERPSHLMIQVTGRKDIVCLYLDYDKNGRLTEAHPVGLEDGKSKLPFVNLDSCFPAHIEYKYDERGRLVEVKSLEAARRPIDGKSALKPLGPRKPEAVNAPGKAQAASKAGKVRFETVKVETLRKYAYDAEGRLKSALLRDGGGTREYSFLFAPRERRLYRIGPVSARAGVEEFKQYDPAGRLERWQTLQAFDDGLVVTCNRYFERDAQGRVTLERIVHSGPDNAEEWAQENRYEFDGRGNMIRYSEKPHEQPEQAVRRYDYDAQGNWTRAEYYSIHDGEQAKPEPAVLERRIRYYPD